MRNPVSRLALLVLGIGLLACSGLGGKDDDDEEEEEDEEQGSGDSPEDVCAQMLACAAAVQPGSEDSLESTYGAGGTCWSGDMAAQIACGDACESALATYAEAWPDEPACNGGGGDDSGTPTDGCALADGQWSFDFTWEYDSCGFEESPMEGLDTVIDCYDEEQGAFTWTDELFFGDTAECYSEGRDFVCGYDYGEYVLTITGTASGQAAATAEWSLNTADCDGGGLMDLYR